MASEPAVIGEYEARRVQRMLARLYAGHLKPDESIAISGWREGTWLCLRWELARADRSLVYPVECRLDLKAGAIELNRARDLIYDFLGHFFGQYLRQGRAPFTGSRWEEVQFVDQVLHLRGVERDEAADRHADAMLVADARDGDGSLTGDD